MPSMSRYSAGREHGAELEAEKPSWMGMCRPLLAAFDGMSGGGNPDQIPPASQVGLTTNLAKQQQLRDGILPDPDHRILPESTSQFPSGIDTDPEGKIALLWWPIPVGIGTFALDDMF